MENLNVDNYLIDVRKNLIKVKFITFGAISFAIIAIAASAFIIITGAKTAAESIRIIDRQGYTYSSTLTNSSHAIELQHRAFINNFTKLCYSFDANNIEDHLNRALQLGDNSVGGYIQIHSKPNEIYHAVRGLGREAQINESDVLDNLIFGADHSFRTSFIQIVESESSMVKYNVTISGSLAVITPNGIDNPNGLFIVNFIETYEKI